MSVTIAALQVPNWQRDGDVVLRIYALSSFVAADGTEIVAGSASNDSTLNNNWFQTYVCTVAQGVLSIPQIVLPSTTDSLDNSHAAYTALLFTAEGDFISQFGQFGHFQVSPTPPATSWAAVAAMASLGSASVATSPLQWAGVWTATKSYGLLSFCSSQNSLYVAVAPSLNETPGTGSSWALMIAAPTGLPGAAGASAYQVYQQAGGLLNQSDWLASLQGPAGQTSYAMLAKALQVALQYSRDVLGVTTPNLFNPASVQVGSFIDNPSGAFNSGGGSGYYVAPFVCAGLSQITVSAPSIQAGYFAMVFRDISGATVSSVPSATAGGYTFNVPASAVYGYFSGRTDNPLAQLMIVPGPTLPQAYVAFGYQAAEAVNFARESAAIQAGIDARFPLMNLFDPTAATHGYWAASNPPAYEAGDQSFLTTAIMKVQQGKTYTLALAGSDSNAAYGGAWLDVNNKPVRPISWPFTAGQQFVAQAGECGMQLSYSTQNNWAKQMLTLGTAVPAAYLPPQQEPFFNVPAPPPPAAQLGSGFTISDGFSSAHATSVGQINARVAAAFSSAGATMNLAGRTIRPYGDSITAGFQLAGAPIYWQIAASTLGLGILNNYARAGDEVADTTFLILNQENPAAATNAVYTLAIGTNDMNAKGVGAHEATFNLAHQACIAWLGTQAETRTQGSGSSADSGGGNWSNGTFGLVNTKVSTAVGGAWSEYTITTYGRPIYLWTLMADGASGFANVSLDGTAVTMVSLAPPSVILTGGQQRTVALQLTRIPCAAGAHTLHITNTGSGVTIVAVGTPPQHAYYGSQVCVAGVPYVQGDAKAAATAQYTADILANVKLLQSDGLDVRFFDNRAALQDGALALYQTPGDLHPNPAGHVAMAPYLITAIQSTPSRAVSRYTPPAGSKGTPGDTWAGAGAIYGVQADGSILSTSTATIV